jgi:hypothetical protein
MPLDAAIARRSRRRVRWSDKAVLAFAALALAFGAAAWMSDSSQSTSSFASAALPSGKDRISFEERFSSLSSSESAAVDLALLKLREAKGLLAQQLKFGDWRTALVDRAGLNEDRSSDEAGSNASKPDAGWSDASRPDASRPDESRPSPPTGTPLPKSRPAAADMDSRLAPAVVAAAAASAARPDDRTLMQKLSDLLPKRVTLASLTPDFFREGPDLASLGYDNLTAVYDISAHAVYLPNGTSLEAHSGMGGLRDDPDYVSVPNVGATPPAVYELKPRERLFHGVRALRMIPAEGSTTNGRSGLLTHSYMLGPNGDSNGCVSIKNYDRFLKAFNDGEVSRIVVVPSLSDPTVVAQRSNTPS